MTTAPYRATFPGLLAALLLTPSLALARPDAPPQPATPAPASPDTRPRDVDLVICLDSSGSMNGLLDSCRQKLWDICTQLAQARPAPKLRVALLSFGSERNPAGGYVVVEAALTDELDQVYERLFALQPTGSTELVGRALHEALSGLQWSTHPGALKLILVAGNESADQDREHDVRAQVQQAVARQVVVSAIYCGDGAPGGDADSWRELSRLGGGEFAAIDQQGTIAVASPYDAEITRLGGEVNATYLPYGVQGRAGAENQLAQDANAASCNAETLAARMQLKGSVGLYRNDSWDLVDARAREGFDWSKLEERDLPEVLRGKSIPEREVHLRELATRRAAIQARIGELGKLRSAFVQAELARHAAEHGRSLDFAVARAVRKAAEARGFRFD